MAIPLLGDDEDAASSHAAVTTHDLWRWREEMEGGDARVMCEADAKETR